MVKNNKKKEEAIENISLIKAKPPKNVTNRDQYARMSHLYQISQCLSTRVENEALSRYYAQTMDSVSKKTVLKINPAVKRTICKKCSRIQIPGYTCSISITNPSKSGDPKCDVYCITCDCGKIKRFPVGEDRGYTLFSENQEAFTSIHLS